MFGHKWVKQSAQHSARATREWQNAGRSLGPHQRSSCEFQTRGWMLLLTLTWGRNGWPSTARWHGWGSLLPIQHRAGLPSLLLHYFFKRQLIWRQKKPRRTGRADIAFNNKISRGHSSLPDSSWWWSVSQIAFWLPCLKSKNVPLQKVHRQNARTATCQMFSSNTAIRRRQRGAREHWGCREHWDKANGTKCYRCH